MSLDLNIVYYHIDLSPGSKQICTIVLPYSECKYQKYSWGFVISVIFQGRVSKLFNGFDTIHIYIYDLLVITRYAFTEHINTLDKVLQKLVGAGLKINA